MRRTIPIVIAFVLSTPMSARAEGTSKDNDLARWLFGSALPPEGSELKHSYLANISWTALDITGQSPRFSPPIGVGVRIDDGHITKAVIYNDDSRIYFELPPGYIPKLRFGLDERVRFRTLQSGSSDDDQDDFAHCARFWDPTPFGGYWFHEFTLGEKCHSISVELVKDNDDVSYLEIPAALVDDFLHVVTGETITETFSADLKIGTSAEAMHAIDGVSPMYRDTLSPRDGREFAVGRLYRPDEVQVTSRNKTAFVRARSLSRTVDQTFFTNSTLEQQITLRYPSDESADGSERTLSAETDKEFE